MNNIKEENNTSRGMNIDDAWWANEIGKRREEIIKTKAKKDKLESTLRDLQKEINGFNDKIAEKESKIDITNIILQLQIPFATLSLLVSLLAGGLKMGLITWGGVTAVQAIGAIGTKIVKGHYRKQIEILEEERGTHDIKHINCSNELNMLKNKITVLQGGKFPRKASLSEFIAQETYRGIYESDCPFDTKDPSNFEVARTFEEFSRSRNETNEEETMDDNFCAQNMCYQYHGNSESFYHFNSTVYVPGDNVPRNAAMAKMLGEYEEEETLSAEAEEELVGSKIETIDEETNEDKVEETNEDKAEEVIEDTKSEPQTPKVEVLSEDELCSQYDELFELFSHSDGIPADREAQKLAADRLLDEFIKLNEVSEEVKTRGRVKTM